MAFVEFNGEVWLECLRPDLGCQLNIELTEVTVESSEVFYGNGRCVVFPRQESPFPETSSRQCMITLTWTRILGNVLRGGLSRYNRCHKVIFGKQCRLRCS